MIKSFLTTILLLLITGIGYSQFDIDTTDHSKMYVITTTDGGNFVGHITYYDNKEVIVNTKKMGEVSIPKYQIKSIEELSESNMNNSGEFIPNEIFSTRYFITTNGLPIEKGENYIQWNLSGPDLQFGVAKNFGVGVMTSWIGMPIIASMKYSFSLGENVNFGLGMLAGTGSWASPQSGGILPFGVFTIGDRRSNLNISGGYAALFFQGNNVSQPLVSIAGMTKVGKKVSLVFDSFIITGNANSSPGGLLIPGIRIQTDPNKAFQFGFGGIVMDSRVIPFPIPMLQWYRKI